MSLNSVLWMLQTKELIPCIFFFSTACAYAMEQPACICLMLATST